MFIIIAGWTTANANLYRAGLAAQSLSKINGLAIINYINRLIADISKAKLTIYLDETDLVGLKKKKVYLDGKLSEYKVSRSLNIADSRNISKYMAQIIIESPKVFSKLVKVEIK